jgi:hypothetical protein
MKEVMYCKFNIVGLVCSNTGKKIHYDYKKKH